MCAGSPKPGPTRNPSIGKQGRLAGPGTGGGSALRKLAASAAAPRVRKVHGGGFSVDDACGRSECSENEQAKGYLMYRPFA